MPKESKEKIEKMNNIDRVKKVTKTEKSLTKKSAKASVKSDSTTKSKVTNKNKTTTRTPSKSKSTVTLTNSKSATQSKAKSTVNTKSRKTVTKLSHAISTEYYDLPFRYNQTIVRILAQTPDTLFIYWDISDEDRKSYVQKYGEDFFEHTRPYLIITNQTMNYSFEVEINDFANSWYLHINDADCEYKVELGRKFVVNSNNRNINNTSLEDTNFESYQINDYLYITSSNELEMPNDHILFDELGNSVFFRNIKTNITEEKNISSISFLQKIGKVYNIYDLYKEIYQDEFISDEFGLNLPSSISSSFK